MPTHRLKREYGFKRTTGLNLFYLGCSVLASGCESVRFWHVNSYGRLRWSVEQLTLGLDGIDGLPLPKRRHHRRPDKPWTRSGQN